MRVSDLQTKDVVNQMDGRNIGRIIDIDINEDGIINYFIVEPKKIIKRINFNSGETSINLKEIVKIGKDVIIVDKK